MSNEQLKAMRKEDIKTIEEGKQYLRENFKAGVECPCCRQYVKLYPRKLTSSMAYALILIYQHHAVEGSFGAYYHVEDMLKMLDIPSSIRGDFPKLRYWGLIERKPAEQTPPHPLPKGEGQYIPGYYRITPKGIQFVKGLVSVPRVSLLYNNQFWGHEGPDVDIKAVLKDKFDYKELMGSKK